MDDFKYFMPFGKVEKTDDGCRMVSGYASTPRLDLDGEVVSTAAVKKALPAYMEWRNIRQMHQPIAVGVAKEAHTDDEGLYITARIVDPACVKLIDEDVLKGFSIGGKKLSKKGNVITDIELIEISVVDRPANPDCAFMISKSAKGAWIGERLPSADEPESETSWFRRTFEKLLSGAAAVPMQTYLGKTAVTIDYDDGAYVELAKREFSDKERSDAAASGAAMPGGGYPIKTRQDLSNAIQAFGRAKDKDATRKHITARARALGATDALPADWDGSTKEKAAVPAAEGLLFGGYIDDELFGGPGIAKTLELADDPLFGGTGKAVNIADDPLFGGTGTGDITDDPLFGGTAATVETPPGLLELAASAFGEVILKPSVRDRLVKGCGVVADLAYAFSNIRDAQRRLIGEGLIEKDGDDAALAQKLGEIASELATVMAQKAEHEGSEAVFLTDADDITSYILREGAFEMQANDTDLQKRRAQSKAMFGKAAHHLMMAGKSNASMMGCVAKLGALHGAMARKIAEAQKLGKAAEGEFDHGAAMKLIKEAHGHATEAGDHMEMAHTTLGKALGAGMANGTNIGGWGGSTVAGKTQEEMTEGEVPWYDADEPYPGKAAKTATATPGAVPDGFVSKEMAELMAKNAALEATNTLLNKTPGGVFKGRTVIMGDAGKAAAEHAPEGAAGDLSVMMTGIDHVDQNDPESVKNATGRMIGNMLANSQRFGKSVFDPGFRGAAGVKRVS